MSSHKRKTRYLERLKEVHDLVSFSPILLRIREVANNPKASAADLANVILHDHALSTRVLKLANSTYYYHYHKKISTLTHAVVVLGFNTIKNLALSVSFYEYFRQKGAGARIDMNMFWIHSISTAMGAHILAGRTGYRSREEAFVAGFLHDLGKLIIATFTPDDWDAIEAKIKQGYNPLQAEFYRLGTYHTVVGEYVARQWHFPEVLLESMLNHHRLGFQDSARSKEPLVDIIYLANVVANQIYPVLGAKRLHMKVLRKMASQLFDMKGDELEDVMDEVRKAVEETAEDLAVPMIHPRLLESADRKADEFVVEVDEGAVLKFGEEPMKEAYFRKAQELSFSQEFIQSVVLADSADDILTMLAEGMVRWQLFDRVYVLRVDRRHKLLKGEMAYGVESQDWLKEYKTVLTPGESLFADVLFNNRAVLVADVANHPDKGSLDKTFVQHSGANSFGCVPVHLWGTPEALLVFDNDRTDTPISDEHLTSVRMYALQAGMAIERLHRR